MARKLLLFIGTSANLVKMVTLMQPLERAAICES
jgi:hypothetical protein